jgi:hypothetical protein
MPIPTSIDDLSLIPDDNSPQGTESPTTADNYFRAHAALLKGLKTDLQNSTDPAKGVAILGRGVVAVDSIAALLALPSGARREDLLYEVCAFHNGLLLGGGAFRWRASAVKTGHNGGTVIDPNRPVFLAKSISISGVDAWFTAATSGLGVFVRDSQGIASTSPTIFGSIGGSFIVDQRAFIAANAANKSVFVEPVPEPYILDRFNPVDNAVIWGLKDLSRILFAPGDKGSTDAGYGGAVTPSGRNNVVLMDFLVDGNKANITATALVNVECVNFKFCTLSKSIGLTVINSPSDGIDLDDCTDCESIDITAIDCNGYGVHISERSVRCHTKQSTAIRCGVSGLRGGFDVFSSASHSSVQGCTSIQCYRGVVVSGGTSWVANHQSYSDINNGIRLETGSRAEGGLVVGTSNGNGVTMLANSKASNLIVRDCVGAGVAVIETGCALVGVEVRANTGVGISWALPSAGSGQMVGCKAAANAGGDITATAVAVIEGSGNVQADNQNPIGTIAIMQKTTASGITRGTVLPAGELIFSNASGSQTFGVPAGYWRAASPCGGSGSVVADRVAQWQRIA